jgi:hypothetical protein
MVGSAPLALCLALQAAAAELCPEGVLAGTPAVAQARLGWSVALSGTTAAVSAPFGNGTVPLSGVVHVYERSATGWALVQTLAASDGLPGDGFGNELALQGDRLVVGAVWRDGPGIDAGAVYVFERSAGVWGETARLTPHDHADHDWFGRAVDVDGERIAVGASLKANPGFAQGAAYVFERTGSLWVETAALKASDGAPNDFFGGAVDLDGDRLLIGAHGGDSFAAESGGAYVFERTGAAWSESAKLVAADGKANDDLGIELALAGDLALLASFGDDGKTSDGGSFYAFEKGASGWNLVQEVFALDSQAGDGLGSGLAFDGDLAVVGAQHTLAKAGAVYAFRRSGGLFHEEAKLTGAPANALFGFDVAVSGAEILGGAPESGAFAALGGEARPARLAAGAALFGCPAWFSLAAGGSQALDLDAGQGQAGALYIVAGSSSGTVPGFAFGGLAIPLNLDSYFFFSVSHANVPPLLSTLGFLDAQGRAQAGFALPPGFDPGLAGIVLAHAALVLDPLTLAPKLATNAEMLGLGF